jgi:hypothetical protein
VPTETGSPTTLVIPPVIPSVAEPITDASFPSGGVADGMAARGTASGHIFVRAGGSWIDTGGTGYPATSEPFLLDNKNRSSMSRMQATSDLTATSGAVYLDMVPYQSGDRINPMLHVVGGTGFSFGATAPALFTGLYSIGGSPSVATLIAQSADMAAAFATPASVTATPSASGGTFAAATYFYKVSALFPWGESAVSSEVSAVVVANGSVALTWGAATGATGYRVYRGTAAGAESAYQVATGNSFTDTGSAGTAGTPPALHTLPIGQAVQSTLVNDGAGASLGVSTFTISTTGVYAHAILVKQGTGGSMGVLRGASLNFSLVDNTLAGWSRRAAVNADSVFTALPTSITLSGRSDSKVRFTASRPSKYISTPGRTVTGRPAVSRAAGRSPRPRWRPTPQMPDMSIAIPGSDPGDAAWQEALKEKARLVRTLSAPFRPLIPASRRCCCGCTTHRRVDAVSRDRIA